MAPLAVVFVPGVIFVPVAIVIAAVHLVWSLQPGRRGWVLHRFGRGPTVPAPSAEERTHLGKTAKVLAVIATVSPGMYLMLPPITFLPVMGVLAYRQATNLEQGTILFIPRPKPTSVIGFARLGVFFGAIPLTAMVVGLWPLDEGFILICLVWTAGLLGFFSIARQFAYIRAYDLETQLKPITLEDLHAHINR